MAQQMSALRSCATACCLCAQSATALRSQVWGVDGRQFCDAVRCLTQAQDLTRLLVFASSWRIIIMAREQVLRWALDHPTCPKTGRYMEVPFLTQTLPRVMGVIGLAGVLWYANPMLLWHKKPVTWTPEFIAEAKTIGDVAVSLKPEAF